MADRDPEIERKFYYAISFDLVGLRFLHPEPNEDPKKALEAARMFQRAGFNPKLSQSIIYTKKAQKQSEGRPLTFEELEQIVVEGDPNYYVAKVQEPNELHPVRPDYPI